MMNDHALFFIKGAAAAVAVLLLTWHMFTTPGPMSWARGLRYVALFVAVAGVAGASWDQVREIGLQWERRQWYGVMIVIAGTVAAIASLMEDRGLTLKRPRRKGRHDC